MVNIIQKISFRCCPGRSAAWGAFLILFLLTACSSLPEIRTAGSDLQSNLRERCQSVFPAAPHQFVHAIEARMPDDSRVALTGIVTVDPERKVIRCVVMTIEGFVLFDARHQQSLTVDRAVHPFDSPEFAENMMADIRLIFFLPGREFVAAGIFDNGFPGCRYLNPDRLAVDVILNQMQGWIIRQYDASEHPSREVRAYALNREGFPAKIDFSHYKFPGYKLNMVLLQSERLREGDERLN